MKTQGGGGIDVGLISSGREQEGLHHRRRGLGYTAGGEVWGAGWLIPHAPKKLRRYQLGVMFVDVLGDRP